jgi:hypothetical protein
MELSRTGRGIYEKHRVGWESLPAQIDGRKLVIFSRICAVPGLA